MKTVLFVHILCISLVAILSFGIFRAFPVVFGRADYDAVFLKVIPVIDGQTPELMHSLKDDLEKYPSAKTQLSFETGQKIQSMATDLRNEIRKNNILKAEACINLIIHTMRSYTNDPMMLAQLDAHSQQICSTSTALELEAALLTNNCLMMLRTGKGVYLDDHCISPLPKLITDCINPRVGDTTQFSLVLTCNDLPYQYLDLTLNGRRITVNNHSSNINLRYDQPGLYPLQVAGRVSLFESDSIASFDKTYYLRVY